MSDPLQLTFVSEAKAHLAQVESQLRDMDRGVGMASASAINASYRAMHTISGLAGYLALTRIEVLAQSAEGLLEEMRLSATCRGGSRIDALLHAVQRIGELVECLIDGTTPVADDNEIIDELRTWTPAQKTNQRRRYGRRDDRTKRRFLSYGNQIPTGPPCGMASIKVGLS